MNLGPHWAFIVTAYAVTVATVAVLIGWVWFDLRAQRQQLAKLEAQGITRRSEKSA